MIAFVVVASNLISVVVAFLLLFLADRGRTGVGEQTGKGDQAPVRRQIAVGDDDNVKPLSQA